MRFAMLGGLILLGYSAAAFTQTAPATAPATAPGRLKITIGKDTTFLTDPPLRGDGTVDYVKAYDAILAKGATTENNLYIPLLQVFGPGSVSGIGLDATLARLGIKSLPKDGDYFVTFRDYLQSTGVPEASLDSFEAQRDDLIGKLWNEKDLPEVAEWLKQEEKHLDAIVAASVRDHYYLPANSPDGTLIGLFLPSLALQRDLARGLSLRAGLRAAQGNIDAARRDAMAIHRHANLLSHSGSMIEMLVSCAIETLATETDAATISSGKLTTAEAKSTLADLQHLPPFGSFVDTCNTAERLCMLDAVMAFVRGKGNAFISVLPSTPDVVQALDITPEQAQKIDWDAILRIVNGHYDAIVAAVAQPTFAQRKAALGAEEKRIGDLQVGAAAAMADPDPTKRIACVVQAALDADLHRFEVLHEIALTTIQLDQLAFALAAYRADHGQYPDTLAPLAPAYIPSIPNDRFTDKPLIYKPTPDGFLLYSVGSDLTDDGGLKRAKVAGGNRDVVIRVGK